MTEQEFWENLKITCVNFGYGVMFKRCSWVKVFVEKDTSYYKSEPKGILIIELHYPDGHFEQMYAWISEIGKDYLDKGFFNTIRYRKCITMVRPAE